MSAHREEVLLVIEGKLLGLTVRELQRVCEHWKIAGKDGEDIKNKTRRALVKLIVQFCERDELLEQEDEGMSVLLELEETLDALQSHRLETVGAGAATLFSSPADDGGETLGRSAQTAGDVQLEVRTPPPPSRERPPVREMVSNSGVQRESRESISGSCCASSSNVFRKDFRINGHVGESTSKDTMSFSSLEHQIESGLRKGYSELEIVEAVIHAVNPGLKLRSYLEGKYDLTLATLRQILRAHYAETDATVLYQQLTKAAQGPNETALEFLIRVLDLRQKVLFASERAQSDLKYNKELVQSQCLQSVMTGLSNDNVRAEMRAYLQDVGRSDESLLQKMQIAQHNESERAQKIKITNKTSYRAGLNLVEQSEGENNPPTIPAQPKPGKSVKENSLFTKIEESNIAIRELSGQVASLLHTVQHGVQARVNAAVLKRPKRRCVACQQTQSDCNHCFKCGSETHWAKGCRVGGTPKQSGN